LRIKGPIADRLYKILDEAEGVKRKGEILSLNGTEPIYGSSTAKDADVACSPNFYSAAKEIICLIL